jgi:hypothetical protein
MAKQKKPEPRALTLEESGRLLRAWQLNEWALDKKATKKARKEQRWIIWQLLCGLTQREVDETEIDYVISGMN